MRGGNSINKDKKQYKTIQNKKKTKNNTKQKKAKIFLCFFLIYMTTLLYSGYYNPNNDTNPFEVDPNFFYLTSCDLPNITII